MTDPYIFTPADLENLAGIPSTVQRDWRRRGILPSNSVEGICSKSESGRWKYTFIGYRVFWIINRLSKFGIGLSDAARLAMFVDDDLTKTMRILSGSLEKDSDYCRYALIYPTDQSEFNAKYSRANNLADVIDKLPTIFNVIDIESLVLEFSEPFSKLSKDKADKLLHWAAEDEKRRGGKEC